MKKQKSTDYINNKLKNRESYKKKKMQRKMLRGYIQSYSMNKNKPKSKDNTKNSKSRLKLLNKNCPSKIWPQLMILQIEMPKRATNHLTGRLSRSLKSMH